MAFMLGGDSYFKNVIPLDTSVIYDKQKDMKRNWDIQLRTDKSSLSSK